MKKLLLGCLLLIAAGSVLAAPQLNPSFQEVSYSWQGPYFGLTGGAATGNINANISTNPDGYLSSEDTAAVNQAGNQTLYPFGFTTGIEGGYNWQLGNHYLLGLEADVQTLRLGATINSGNVFYPDGSGNYFTTASYLNLNWLATLRPRIGYIYRNCLFYLTGGLGITQEHANFYFTDNNFSPLESGSIDTTKVGPALGGGFEFGLTQRWNLKAEYLYVYFNKTNASQTGSTLTLSYPYQIFNYSATVRTSLLRLGLNYKFDKF